VLDNLHDSSDAPTPFGNQANSEPQAAPSVRPLRQGLLGMTALQRLVIASLLMIAVCVLGTMCLLVTGRIGTF
jgi:hypothetical protein